MIGKSTYIRSFTPLQRQQLEAIAKEQNLNTVPDIFFFVLEKYFEHKGDKARLERIIAYKQRKIERLENPGNDTDTNG